MTLIAIVIIGAGVERLVTVIEPTRDDLLLIALLGLQAIQNFSATNLRPSNEASSS